MSETNHYQTLNIELSSTKEEIIAAYRKLAMKWHPDRHQNEKDKVYAEIKFKVINVAYTILSDDNQRAHYNASLRNNSFNSRTQYKYEQSYSSKKEPNHQSSKREKENQEKWDEYLNKKYKEQIKRGADIKKTVTISIDQAIHGGRIIVEFSEKSTCTHCEGYGFFEYECPKCSQRGHADRDCSFCDGQGSISKDCVDCNGSGKTTKKYAVEINLPGGVIEGNIFVAKEKGSKSKYGGYNGDLIVTIKIKSTTLWSYEGANIHGLIKIPFPIAMLGGECHIELPTGKTITLTIPPNTNTGKKFKLPQKGLHYYKDKTQGDTILTVNIVLPTIKKSLTEAEKELLKSMI
jgi:molecular chaperone DnaJ